MEAPRCFDHEKRIGQLEGKLEESTEQNQNERNRMKDDIGKLFDRIRLMEIRMAAIVGGGAVIYYLIDRFTGK